MKIQEVASKDILSELSNQLLGKYKTAASKSAKAADQSGDYGKGDKRFNGIVTATKKQFNNDAKKHGVTEEHDEESDFANELYSAFEQQYPNLCAKAGAHVVGNAITDFMNYEGQIPVENLVTDLARAVRSNMTSVEF